jgi:DNA polymerase zeta
MYVKPEVRRGLLGRMLTELLDTRVMVKQAMKRAHDNKVSIPKFTRLHKDLMFLPSDTDQDTRRTPAGIEVHRQRNIWVHECNILR